MKKNDDLENKDEPTAYTPSAPHSALRPFWRRSLPTHRFACPPARLFQLAARLSVPVSFWRGFVANTNIYHCWGVS